MKQLTLSRRRRRVPQLLFAGALLAASSLAQAPIAPTPVPEWEQLGPLAGAGPAVLHVVQSADADRVYASSTAGLLMSDDRGQTWSLRSPSPNRGGFLFTLAASPDDPDKLLMGRRGEVRLSADGGVTWYLPTTPPTGDLFYQSPEFAPSDASRVYVSSVQRFWRSSDGGQNFDSPLSFVDEFGSYASRLVVDPTDALHVYAAVGSVGLIETTDGGDSWSAPKPFPGSWTGPLSMTIDAGDGQRLLLGGAGAQLTADGGSTWTDVSPSSEYVDAVAIDPNDPQVFFAARRYEGVNISRDGGATWTQSFDPGLVHMGSHPTGIATSPDHRGQVLLSSTGGVFRSTDSGLTFERRNHGLDALANVESVAIDPFDATHLVAKTGGSAFVSNDSGATWIESTVGHSFVGYSVVADAAIPGRFYAGGQNGKLWRSDDGGHTFYVVFFAPPVYFWHLEPHPTVGGRLFGAGRGVRRSDDGGVTFTNTGVGASWIWDVAISPVDPDVMYASSSSTVYRSLDGGASWDAAVTPPAAIVRDLVADPADVDRAYAATPLHGLFRTDDRGMTWNLVGPETTQVDAVILPAAYPGWVVAASFYRWEVLVSRTGGSFMNPMSRGLSSVINTFASSATDLFAASSGGGVLVLR